MPTTPARTEKLDLRLTPQAKEKLFAAAKAQERTVSDFVLQSALDRADEALADSWINLPNSNPIFGGKPALSLMTDGGIDGLYQTRRLIDSRLG